MKQYGDNVLVSCLKYFLPVIVLLICFSQSAADEKVLDFDYTEDGQFRPFPSMPARDLMTSKEHAGYNYLLDTLQCEAAKYILNTAFVREYPQFSAALKCRDGRHNPSYNRWDIYAPGYFNELGFCESRRDFMVSEAHLDMDTQSPIPYRAERRDERLYYPDRHLMRRNSNIRSILYHADRDHAPALVFVADLVRRGDLFAAGDEVELYLLTRACHLGHDCGPLSDRIESLRESVPDHRERHVAIRAKQGKPFVEDAVMDGVVP